MSDYNAEQNIGQSEDENTSNNGPGPDIKTQDELAGFKLDPIERRYLGPLLRYMTPDKIENVREFIINKPGEIAYEYIDGTWKFEEAPELTQEQLEDAARMLASRFGLIFSPANPILSCKMPAGHRVQVISGGNCSTGFSMAIRFQRKAEFTLDDYGLDKEQQEQIINAVKNKKTLLISGGTGSGKTSFMNVLLKYLAEDERIITMEDVPELELHIKNWLPLLFTSGKGQGNSNINDVLNACLRMRPDRIILGEIRKENAFAFCSAINTGHDGSMATIHASDPQTAIEAILNRVLMNGDISESALNVLRKQLENDIHAVVQLNRIGSKVKGYIKVLTPGSTEEVDLDRIAQSGVQSPSVEIPVDDMKKKQPQEATQPEESPQPERPKPEPAPMRGAPVSADEDNGQPASGGPSRRAPEPKATPVPVSSEDDEVY